MSDSINITITQGYTGTDQIVQGLLSSQVPLNTPPIGSLSFSPGTGASQVAQECEVQIAIPAAGQDTINLNTGAVTGSNTVTLTNGSGATFALAAGLKVCEIDLLGGTGSASSINLFAGASNGFTGWMGSSTMPLKNGASNAGAHFRQIAGDSIGFAVSSSLANLVVKNNDTINVATVNFYLAGN